MTPSNSSGWLEKVYAARTDQDLQTSYDGWAEVYDQDVFHFGYTILTGVMCGMVARYIQSTDSKVLDAGCGTGIVGQTMSLLGYKDLSGIDLSNGMLKVSEKKGAYHTLRQMKLGEALDFTSDSFDAVVSMGVFTEGHAPASALDELLRLTRPGGHLVYSTRIDAESVQKDFAAKEKELIEAGKWTLLEKTPPFQSLPLEEPDVLNVISAFRVL